MSDAARLVPKPFRPLGVKIRKPVETEKNVPPPEDVALSVAPSSEPVIAEDKEVVTTVPVMLGKKKTALPGQPEPLAPLRAPFLKRVDATIQKMEEKAPMPDAAPAAPAAAQAQAKPAPLRMLASKKATLKKLKAVFDVLASKGETIEELFGEEQDGRFFFPIDIPIPATDLAELDSEFKSLRFTPVGFYTADLDDPTYAKDLARLRSMFAKLVELPTEEVKEDTTTDFDFSESEFDELAKAIEYEKTHSTYVTPKPTQGYVPQTRRSFAYFITQAFKDFALAAPPKDPDYDACFKMGAQGATKAEIYQYQQFVRDYMSWDTPYRGVLVYHGLGSGKTCTAIAAAEALHATANRKLIVMTPYSLRKNFLSEISFCGFRHFRLLNHWTSYPNNLQTDPLIRMFATKVLNIPVSYLQKKTVTRIWIPDFEKAQNFQAPPDSTPEQKQNYLTSGEQQQVREQIQATLVWDPTKEPTQMNGRIWFINYNGIPSKTLKELACRKPSNVFDNAVIVIDEIHNVTRLMQGTIEPYLSQIKGTKRKLDYEPMTADKWAPKLCGKAQNYKRGYLLYRMLVEAKGTKIIGLSGTPLINFPEELAILANVLHGYLHIAEGSFPVTGSSDANEARRKAIEDVAKANPYIDFYQVIITDRAINMTVTTLPEGIRKLTSKGIGVERIPPGESAISFQERLDSLKADLKAKGLALQGELKVTSQPLLPPDGETFREKFLENDGVTLKNSIVLMKRLSGLISYYKGARKDLMPEVTKDIVVRVPFSPYQQEKYSQVRLEEIDIEEQKKATPTGGIQTGRLAEIYAQIYDVKSVKQNSNYRMGSRQACNFVFPPDMTRPRPRTQAEAIEEIAGDKEDIVDGVIEAGPDAGSVVLGKEELLEDRAQAAQVAFEEEETEKEQEDRVIATRRAELVEQGLSGEELEKALEAIRLELRELQQQIVLSEQSLPAEGLSTEEMRCRIARLPGEKYTDATERIKQCLLKYKRDKLQVDNPDGLDRLSTKFKAMLDRIQESKGSSLVYSQFLTMEGIGIFAVVMQANGFDEIVIDPRGGGQFTPETVESLKKGPSTKQFRFIKFTGGEDESVRRFAIDIFNARFSNLPKAMADVLTEAGYKDNKAGELCRVFCITSAGAEGLSLKNVRTVHIMEPYWNEVRTAQVKGRAVRICSHMDLPVPDRNVEIFTYLSVFSEKAQLATSAPPDVQSQLELSDPTFSSHRISQKIFLRDSITAQEAKQAGLPIPAKATAYTLTSDERLYLISQRKKTLISNLERAMKSVAADCFLNFKENDDGTYKCLLLEQVGDFMYNPDLNKDITETSDALRETAPQPMKPQAVEGVAPPKTEAQAPPMRKGLKAKISDKYYQIFPVLDGSKKVLHYDIYDETDVLQQKVLGRVEVDEKGKPIKGSQKFF